MPRPSVKIATDYRLGPENAHADLYPKRQVILAASGREGLKHHFHNQVKEAGTSKQVPHFTVDRDGTVYGHVEPTHWTEFTGRPETDRHAIVVVLANMGWLYYDYPRDQYFNWTGCESCDREDLYEREWRNYRYWEKYPLKQINAAIKLCKHLCDTYDIPANSFGHNVEVADIEKFEGVTMRSHFSKSHLDLNPSFDFKKLFREISQ